MNIDLLWKPDIDLVRNEIALSTTVLSSSIVYNCPFRTSWISKTRKFLQNLFKIGGRFKTSPIFFISVDLQIFEVVKTFLMA